MPSRLLLPLAMTLPLLGCTHGSHRAHGHAHGEPAHGAMPHRFEDPQKWSAVFDDPARDAWQKPAEVVEALGLRPGDRVADVGAGTGYFSLPLARAVPRGRVFAVDLEPAMARHVEHRAREAGLSNVRGVVATAASPQLPEKVDLVLIVNTYHHLEDRLSYFDALREQLRPGGRVAIVDFTMDSPHGPPPEHRVTDHQVKAEMVAAGYPTVTEPLRLPHQYLLVFSPERRR
jgi:cyclopropane fatty-acyl-phospholipid synthase-like methyltransferase